MMSRTQPEDDGHPPPTGNDTATAYDLFILVLTVLSLLIMVALFLPVNAATKQLLTAYDNLICVIFLFDLTTNLIHDRPKRSYFVDRRGWLDLLGSIPSASVLELAFESGAPNANITTGGDALWWAVVTITTVGYGDFYPVTAAGRITGVFVMFTGIGIIGALASILASILVAPTDASQAPPEGSPDVARELAQVRDELSALRASISPGGGDRTT